MKQPTRLEIEREIARLRQHCNDAYVAIGAHDALCWALGAFAESVADALDRADREVGSDLEAESGTKLSGGVR